ncbi:MAG TPA: hypothetical protein VEB19_13960 [Gemmatimonadaceae bacterium]|nr:hypothetical protein [Gemmatimonadaceae bacterium]
MTKYTGRLIPILAVAFIAACSGNDSNADSALAADTMLNRDLALAGTDTAAQPQLTDVPAAPSGGASTPTKSATPARTPTPSGTKTSTPTKTASGNTKTAGTGTASRSGSIAAGSALNVRANSDLCTNTHKVGDTFQATVNEAVVGSNGATIPAGATVTLTVTKLNRSENVNDPIEMEFSVDRVAFSGKSYNINGSVASLPVERVRNQPKSKDVQKVVGGAAIGAIAGQVLGKNTKSTVIGAAAGAAAGAATAAATANYEGCVRAGGNFVVTLSDAVTITT